MTEFAFRGKHRISIIRNLVLYGYMTWPLPSPLLTAAGRVASGIAGLCRAVAKRCRVGSPASIGPIPTQRQQKSKTATSAPRTRKLRGLAGLAPLPQQDAGAFGDIVLRCLATPEMQAMFAASPGLLVTLREFCGLLGVDLPYDFSALALLPAPVSNPDPAPNPTPAEAAVGTAFDPRTDEASANFPQAGAKPGLARKPTRRTSAPVLTPTVALVFFAPICAGLVDRRSHVYFVAQSK